MISRHTVPGTKVVCIKNAVSIYHTPLVVGQIYTVDKIDLAFDGEAVVLLREVANLPRWLKAGGRWIYGIAAYALWQFRYAELPSSITDCLNVEKIPLSVKRECQEERV